MTYKQFKDEDGIPIRSNDYVTFTFGIPPISVLARVTGEQGDLSIECVDPSDVKPKREKLSSLMKWYQVWKAPSGRVAAYERNFILDKRDQQK